MPFIYKKNLKPGGGRVLIPFTITDATVLSEGEACKLSSGKLVTWGAGGVGLGIVVGFQKADGSPVTDDGASGDYAGTYTAGSSNTVQAMVDVSLDSIYSCAMDTTGANAIAGSNIDCAAGSQSLVYSSIATTTASFFIWSTDTSIEAPDNSLLVSIQESQMKI